MKYILREITPLSKESLFFVAYYPFNELDFPLHFHEDYELNLTLGIKGKRVVGNKTEDFGELDLVIIGPNVQHCYRRSEECAGERCDVIYIQFNKNLQLSSIFNTEQLRTIKEMLDRAATGIRFSENTALVLKDKFMELFQTKGFGQVTLFFEILHELSTSPSQVVYSTVPNAYGNNIPIRSRRINKIIKFVETNYSNRIALEDISRLVGMSPSSVSRLFKHRTQLRFWDYLSDFRIDRASDMLVTTELSVSEICFECGFNNISNFNRSFKARQKITPSQYRSRFKASIEERPSPKNYYTD